MKKFLEFVKRLHEERFAVVINRIVEEKIPVAVVSVQSPEVSLNAVKNFREQGINVTTLIAVDPPSENSMENLAVVHLNDVSKLHPRPEYIFATNQTGARLALKYLPECKILLFASLITENIYNTFMSHIPELYEIYDSLIDEESKITFRGYWLGNILNQLGEIHHASSPHYLTAGFIPEPGAVVIDGGAFDGGTAAVLSGMGCKVYSFEMDKINYEFAKKIAEEKNFVIENFGLGSHNHEMNYNHGGSASNFDANGSETAKVITLDSYVRENKLPRVDYIKLDVEGAELDVLRGATVTIGRWKPILAISAYHKWDDFWTLYNFVKSIRSDYEFAMRQYATTPEDAPTEVTEEDMDMIYNIGLEPDSRWFNECVLLAR